MLASSFLQLQVAVDLLKRYAEVLRLAWRERERLDPPHRLAHETAFLPAALALQETPVSPAPRVALWLLLLFSFCALLWAIFGHIDIVATTHGKLVPNDRTKVIQPMETAVVRAIHVTDGQQVELGDLLVELDDTSATADSLRLANELTAARLLVLRMQAFLSVIAGGVSLRIEAIESIETARIAQEQRMLEGQHAEFRAKLAQLDADIAKRQAELDSTQEVVKKLQQTAPIARRRAEDLKGLVEKNFVARHVYLEREQERIEQEADLATQRSRLNELKAACQEARNRQFTFLAETRRTALDRLHEAEQRAIGLKQELVKAETRANLMRLTAPVAGTVQELAVHTVGGVVTPAQALMMIVPKDNPLEVEVFVENKDIGFVNAGQRAEIKIETFPFTKYGTIDGQIIQVSNDAINDPNRGLIYSARVRPERTTMRTEGKSVNLSPGMAATVEIKTGKRRVIEFFLSPLMQQATESLHER